MPFHRDRQTERAVGEMKNILVVDDDPEVLGCLCYHLGEQFSVMTAASGSEAVRCLSEAICLVILDYRLPDMSGIEVLKEIKRTRPSTHVIIVTGYGDEDVAVKALRYGAMDYLKKPFTMPELAETIRRCLGADIPLLTTRDDASSIMTVSGSICHDAKPHSHYRIQNAIKYISDNYSSKITLARVAAKACMSKYHFSRSFRKVTGTTYRDYLSECRIEKAKDLLIRCDLPITEIAFAVGYTDMTHFARAFKKIAGLAPSQYKQYSKHQAEPANKA